MRAMSVAVDAILAISNGIEGDKRPSAEIDMIRGDARIENMVMC